MNLIMKFWKEVIVVFKRKFNYVENLICQIGMKAFVYTNHGIWYVQLSYYALHIQHTSIKGNRMLTKAIQFGNIFFVALVTERKYEKENCLVITPTGYSDMVFDHMLAFTCMSLLNESITKVKWWQQFLIKISDFKRERDDYEYPYDPYEKNERLTFFFKNIQVSTTFCEKNLINFSKTCP